ncbi:hypothetical protein THASP1DRAFT_28705 [Thamnocephalis sphaerospora]|uniref:Uncharacterized protein n=1 Tax=Thamnocephalis sphaerospora TaxID=78915 RepID=A0A4P9XV78_9FUNG|nr:hypothetical protein THASP1DRAFT_28705 [Thamnocephalis sphaerospora]|eukprot:RKP09501.1 hypothetical protein THASP1DRAFT_28705 [Thamnocephalis sphaerospora]
MDITPIYAEDAKKAHLDTVVTAESTRAHIILLSRFQALARNDEIEDDLYLLRAEQRYFSWLDYLNAQPPSPMDQPTRPPIVPPLDVALVWCAHMLAPLRYMEDVLRLYGEHMLLFSIPIQELIKVDVFGSYIVDTHSKACWEAATGLSYEVTTTDTSPFLFTCPFCAELVLLGCNAYRSMRNAATSANCPECRAVLSIDTISAKLFDNDVKNYMADENKLLRGTWLSHTTGCIERKFAKKDLQYIFKGTSAYHHTDVGASVNWRVIERRMEKVHQELRKTFSLCCVRQDALRLIFEAYRNCCTSVSIDLVHALYTKHLLGRIVNHGDTADEHDMNSAYSATAELWQRHLHEPYTLEHAAQISEAKLRTKFKFLGKLAVLPIYVHRWRKPSKARPYDPRSLCQMRHGLGPVGLRLPIESDEPGKMKDNHHWKKLGERDRHDVLCKASQTETERSFSSYGTALQRTASACSTKPAIAHIAKHIGLRRASSYFKSGLRFFKPNSPGHAGSRQNDWSHGGDVNSYYANASTDERTSIYGKIISRGESDSNHV